MKKSNECADKSLMTIAECATKNSLTRQSIFRAISMKRIKAKKIDKLWYITQKDFDEYLNGRHSRKFSTYNGERIYSDEILSAPTVATMFSVDVNRIYLLLKKNSIPHKRVRTAYLIKKQDALNAKKIICDYKPQSKSKKKTPK